MYFTQDDYKKIEAWLQKRAVKDTELIYADQIGETDLVPIVQDGKNKIIPYSKLSSGPGTVVDVESITIAELNNILK